MTGETKGRVHQVLSNNGVTGRMQGNPLTWGGALTIISLSHGYVLRFDIGAGLIDDDGGDIATSAVER